MAYRFDFTVWDLLAILVSAPGLIFGIRLAYYGRVAQAHWRRVVEAIVVAVLTALVSAIVLAVVRPPLQPQLAAAIGLGCGFVAYLFSGRVRADIFGLVGALALCGLVFVASWFAVGLTPFIEATWLAIIPALLVLKPGYELGKEIHAWLVIVTTVWTGACWVSTSALGLTEVLLDESYEHLRDRLLSYVLPVLANVLSVLSILFGLQDLILFAGWCAAVVVVLVTGWNHQRGNIRQGSPRINDLRQWLKDALANRKVWWALSLGAVAYIGLFVALRVCNLGGLNDPSSA